MSTKILNTGERIKAWVTTPLPEVHALHQQYRDTSMELVNNYNTLTPEEYTTLNDRLCDLRTQLQKQARTRNWLA